jgi:hypothetical protein
MKSFNENLIVLSYMCVYPCADAFAAVVLRLRWNFNSCNTYLHSLTHSRCLRTYGRQTYSCKREVQSSDMGPIIWVQLQVMMMMATRSFAKTKFEPCSTSTNFNQFQPTSWVGDFNGWKVALPFPLTSWLLSEINNCTRLADWFLQALLIRIKCLHFNFFPFLFAWHFVVGKMCFYWAKRVLQVGWICTWVGAYKTLNLLSILCWNWSLDHGSFFFPKQIWSF